MLQNIRDRATGVFAYVILFLISIPFALWGIQSYFEGGGKSLAAEVNGEEIPLRVYQNAFQQQKQRLNQMFSGRIPEGLINDDMLRSQAIESLILETVLRQELHASGYRVSDKALLSEIEEMEVFQNNGRFDPQLYNRLLDRQRISKTGFEQQMRDSLLQAQFQEGIVNSALVLRGEVEDYQRLLGQKRDFDYVTIRADEFRAQSSPDEAAIQQYYDDHLNEFLTDERVRVAYVDLNIDEVAQSIPVDEEQAALYYDDQQSIYQTPERRQLSHILFKVEGQRTEQEAMAMATTVQQQIKAGASFEELARAQSEDNFTSKRGGDLGEVQRGEMGTAFDQTAFTLPQGQASNPVRTERGVELILVQAIVPSQQQSFEEVRDQIISEMRQQEAERRFLDLTEKLGTLSYEVPDNLDEAAAAVDLPTKASDWFVLAEGTGIAQEQAIREAAFSSEVLEGQNNSDLIELNSGRVIVLRVLEHEAPQQRDLAEVSDLIRNTLATQEMQRLVREYGREQLSTVQSGQSWDAVVSGRDVKQAKAVTRKESGINPELVGHVFRMNHPQSGPVFSGLTLSNHDYVLVRLNQVMDGETMGNDSGAIATSEGRRSLDAVLNALKERAEIRIYNDNL
jgi:peptidyl-prolyl cis-trans isomerase D